MKKKVVFPLLNDFVCLQRMASLLMAYQHLKAPTTMAYCLYKAVFF